MAAAPDTVRPALCRVEFTSTSLQRLLNPIRSIYHEAIQKMAPLAATSIGEGIPTLPSPFHIDPNQCHPV